MKGMGRKQFLLMIAAMICFVVLYFSLSGPVIIYPALADVFSFSRGILVAESENWRFYVPENGSKESYFVCRTDVYVQPQLQGMVFYDVGASQGIASEEVDGSLAGEKHFYLGEKRWYLSRIWDEYAITGVSFQISWKEGEEQYSEYLSSQKLIEDGT